MLDDERSTEPTPASDSLLMPYERGEPGEESSVAKSLFDVLGSDPEFADDEEPVKDEPKSDDQESDDSDEEVAAKEEEEKESDESEEDESKGDEKGVDQKLEFDDSVLFTVKVDGKETEVAFSELIDGYSRQADYTRKTQQLATDRQTKETELVGELTQTRQTREQLGQQLVLLAQVLAEDSTPPDWEELHKEDPAKFSAEHAAWQIRQDKLKAVQEAQVKLAVDQQADEKRSLQSRMVGEWNKLTEVIPEFRDEKVAAKSMESIQAYLTSTYNAKPDELETVYDHRFIDMARKAMLYDESQTKGKAEIAGKKTRARVLKPGSATPTKKSRGKKSSKQRERAQQRLARSGRVEDAAAALLSMEDE